MSPSSTVHGGQHDTKYVTFELLMHAVFVADETWAFVLEPSLIVRVSAAPGVLRKTQSIPPPNDKYKMTVAAMLHRTQRLEMSNTKQSNQNIYLPSHVRTHQEKITGRTFSLRFQYGKRTHQQKKQTCTHVKRQIHEEIV